MSDRALADHYRSLPREGRLPGRCEMRLPEDLEGLRVVDLLCRGGKGAFKLADRVGAQGFVLACDPDEARVAQAEQRRAEAEEAGCAWARRLAFRCAAPEDLAACGVRDASFDLVYVNAAVNVVYDFDAVLAEAARVLTDGGALRMAGVFAREEAPAPEDPSLAGNVFAHARTFEQVERAAARAGLRACGFTGVEPIVPDGDDAAANLPAGGYVAADARLIRIATF